MKYNTLRFFIDEGIGHIVLDKPPGNPMSLEFFNELADVCAILLKEKDMKGLIIQSAGRHFSSGAIIEELISEVKSAEKYIVPEKLQKNVKIFQMLYSLNKPVVALLKGICYGSGLELALCARYRIATPNTIMCFPEASFGLMPGLGGIQALVPLAGLAKTIEFTLTGNTVNVFEAKKMNIIHDIVQKEALYQTGIKIIHNYRNLFYFSSDHVNPFQ